MPASPIMRNWGGGVRESIGSPQMICQVQGIKDFAYGDHDSGAKSEWRGGFFYTFFFFFYQATFTVAKFCMFTAGGGRPKQNGQLPKGAKFFFFFF